MVLPKIDPEQENACCQKCRNMIHPDKVKRMLKEKEIEIRKSVEENFKCEMDALKERCDFILLNEQIRASHMLCEAHRERQEKITALQTQLECKNLAGLMYVLCEERRKNNLEKLRMKQEYTTYITTLQDILAEAQELILHLSRGYKTAARVDQEWRDKMVLLLNEFKLFIYNYTGATPDENQYFFDTPKMLNTQASLMDDPEEDPCEEEAPKEELDVPTEPPVWWERIDEECAPFVMFGDMEEFQPPQRRAVLTTIKAKKSAPQKWKEYVFNDMFVKADCNNADDIKDVFEERNPHPEWYECVFGKERRSSSKESVLGDHRGTLPSVDIRGTMGSILKIVTSNNLGPNKATLLGAKDSMEIASTTKLREKQHKPGDTNKVIINIGRKTSLYVDKEFYDESRTDQPTLATKASNADDIESLDNSMRLPNDSLELPHATPELDHLVHQERSCPLERCRRLQADSFTRTLPAYMRANPFIHFEQSFEEYETCTPEQIQILKERIELKQKKITREGSHTTPVGAVTIGTPLEEWTPEVEGIATQTSTLSLSGLPPCTCIAPRPSLVSSVGKIYNVQDLIPMKHALDEIHKACFFNDDIKFDRFKVLGQDSDTDVNVKPPPKLDTKERLHKIGNVLRDHPSLLDIFQGQRQC